MKFDFDRVIDRRGTYSVKHDPAAYGLPEDALPLWVADMDFQAPPCVTAALEERVRHGLFGYTKADAGYFVTVQKWFGQRFGWDTEHEWLVLTPGVVNSIYVAIRSLTSPGDGVVIQQPVYHPFEHAIRHTGRRMLVNELAYKDGRYTIDFGDFEDKIKQAGLFILCSPHNPVGRVWTRDELSEMGAICLRHGVLVVSDEIHQDFVYPGSRHHVFANLDSRFADITVTCTAPSKTFNLAGLQLSNNFIPNENLRGRFLQEYTNCGLFQPGVMGVVACKAAYEGGAEWLEELLIYLRGSFSLIRDFLSKNIPRIRLVEPEGTFLAWLDFSELGYSAQELDDLVKHKAKLWLNSGAIFGAGGARFQRMNIACPRSVISEALKRIEAVFRRHI